MQPPSRGLRRPRGLKFAGGNWGRDRGSRGLRRPRGLKYRHVHKWISSAQSRSTKAFLIDIFRRYFTIRCRFRRGCEKLSDWNYYVKYINAL